MLKRLPFFLIILSFGIFLVPALVLAKTTTVDLAVSASSSYTYDNTKIEFSGGTARLKETSSWYNIAWGFRDAITVTNFSGAALTNYPVKISLTTTSLNFWSKVESTGASIRFTSSDGTTLISHFTQDFDFTGNTSTIWVKVPSIAANSSTTIYLYYTNSTASDVSSDDAVFGQTEDFASGSIDTSKWVVLDTYGVFSISSGTLSAAAYEGSGVWHAMYVTSSYAIDRSAGMIFEVDFTTFNVANKDQNVRFGLKNTTYDTNPILMANMPYSMAFGGPYGGSYNISVCENGNTCTNVTTFSANTSYSARIVVYPGGGADYFIKGGAFTDWTFLGRTSYTYTGSLVAGFSKQEAQYTIDNIRVRKLSVGSGVISDVFPRYGSGYVFTTTTAPTWEDTSAVGEPVVMYENSMFKMWYTSSSSLGYATSSDGITWARYVGNPVFGPSGVAGTFDKVAANRVEVIKDGSIYYMYYNGFETSMSGAGKIGLATSSDGITWNRYSGNPILSPGTGWDNFSLYNTAVVKVGSIWYMLYEGKGTGAGDTTQIIGLATSTDGINWTKYSGNPIIRKGFPYGSNYAAAPNLIYNNGKFYTWLMGNDVRSKFFLERAESTDAINWNFYDTPDLYPKNSYEYISVSDASNPIEVGGSTYMYYNGGNQAGVGAVALLKYNGTLSNLLTVSSSYKDATKLLVSTSSLYSTTYPTLIGPGVAYDKITAFNATSTGGGSVTFQISNNGSSWYYWNGSAWASASNSSQSNSSTLINTNITAFSNAYPSGTFYWKAFLVSDGTQTSSLSNLSFVTNLFPTVTIDTISGTKRASVTVNYNIIDPDQDTTNFSQTATSGIEYSLNGSTWSDATASTTGDGLTGLSSTSSPGQAHTFVWDTITDASTTESNTVYLRFRPNDGSDFATSWTTSSIFSLDNVAPSSVSAPTFGTISTTSIEVVKPSAVTDGGTLTYWQLRRDSSTLGSLIATSTTSTTVTSLSPNTQYTFEARFSDLASNTSTFSATSALYTAANVPSLLSATVDGSGTQVALSWNGDATDYYVENTTANTNSNWQTSTQKTFSSLACNTTYVFRVKGRNGDQVNTSWSSEVSARTNQCSGVALPAFTPAAPMSSLAVTLNNQQTTVSSSSVTLAVSAQNAKWMAVANDSSFAGISWEPYNATKDWKLLPGDGQKTVYIKFRSAEGAVSEAYKLNLTLKESNNKPVQTTTTITASKEIVKNNDLNLNIKNQDQYTAGSLLQLSYQYTNDTKKTTKIRVTRELLNSQNKVLKRAYGQATLKPGKSFTNNTKEKLPTTLKDGDYSVRVRVYEQKTGKLIMQDLQLLKVIKKK